MRLENLRKSSGRRSMNSIIYLPMIINSHVRVPTVNAILFVDQNPVCWIIAFVTLGDKNSDLSSVFIFQLFSMILIIREVVTIFLFSYNKYLRRYLNNKLCLSRYLSRS